MRAADFLNELTNPPVGIVARTDPAPSPTTATVGPGESVHPLDTWLAAEDLGQWTCADGRLSGPDVDGGDELEPGEPCPTCGSLDVLVGLWGERTCQRCNADKLQRSLKLEARAERLRQKARTT